MSHYQPAIIWFQLIGSDGKPFKGIGANKVSLTSITDLADLQKAVKAENANSLSSVDAAQLNVYKNKTEYDLKKEPLDPTLSLDGLGSKEEMLIVLVPPSANYSTQLFSPCKIAFYNNLCMATECDRWLLFGQVIPSSTLKRLYIRESYEIIASTIKPGLNKSIITGTPGIGKSLFLIYLLWSLVKAGKRVLFFYHPDTIYYDGQGGVFDLENVPSKRDRAFWMDDLWCLFDAKYKKEEHLIALPCEHCTFVLSMSPKRQMINDFKKPPEPDVFYMPLWSETELKTIAPFFPAAINWRDRFVILGGIPRYVLEATRREPTELLHAACQRCSLNECINSIGTGSTIEDTSKVVHFLVHITSAPPFTESSVCYASQTALDIIVHNNWDQAKRKMRGLLASCERNPLSAALCGYIFEPYAIEMLEKGGTFDCRKLVHGNTRVQPEESTLIIPSSMKTVVERVSPNQTPNQLHVPKTKTYTVCYMMADDIT